MLRSVFPPDPAFVGSAYIQESLPKGNVVGDDDKIYFFFSEAGKEFDFFDNTIVSRIARVCKVRNVSVDTARVCFSPPATLQTHTHTHSLSCRLTLLLCSFVRNNNCVPGTDWPDAYLIIQKMSLKPKVCEYFITNSINNY